MHIELWHADLCVKEVLDVTHFLWEINEEYEAADDESQK